jgi:hypothetical protein
VVGTEVRAVYLVWKATSLRRISPLNPIEKAGVSGSERNRSSQATWVIGGVHGQLWVTMNLGLVVDPSVASQLRGMNLPTLGPGSCISSSHATGKHVRGAATFASSHHPSPSAFPPASRPVIATTRTRQLTLFAPTIP